MRLREAGLRASLAVAALALVAGCATLPPGADYPKTATVAFAEPLATSLGRDAAALTHAHPDNSGVRLFARGEDGLALRAQIVQAAQRSLDIQYFIFIEDDTGKILTQEVRKAADRGVRVRLLVDDLNLYRHPETRATLAALDNHRNIEIRIFNPLSYRGDVPLMHGLDLALNGPRLNHRMHNKLFVADGAVAIIGGRNVADGYFGVGEPPIRFGDFDLAVVGPVVVDLSRSFDEFWNCALAIPQPALGAFADGKASGDDEAHSDGEAVAKLMNRIDSGEPLRGLLSSSLPLAWGHASVVSDPPQKAEVGSDGEASPTARQISAGLQDVHSDLIVISPYFVPGDDGLAALRKMREQGVRVRVLTNSLASTDVPAVHSAYRRYRTALLDAGVEIYEVRPAPGRIREDEHRHGSGSGSGGSSGSNASGTPFALHAKAFVFDRAIVFLGSANLDPRSRTLNTEVGLVIDSPDLAAQVIERFDRFASGSMSYHVTIDPTAPDHALRWSALVDGAPVQWTEEPDTTPSLRLRVDVLSLLPIEPLL